MKAQWEPISRIQEDFDRIALISDGGWGHSNHYHNFLLRQIPTHCTCALDIGCGKGSFARLLAERSDHVIALDLSPNMIRIAGERSKQYPNISFQIADAMTWEFPPDQFDCIASIATLHHLHMEEILSKMKAALRPNGVLVVLDLFKEEGLADMLTSTLSVLINPVLNLVKNGRLRNTKESREVWAEHGQHDSYLTLSQIRQVCDSILPGARVRRHLLWRYSIIWEKGEKCE